MGTSVAVFAERIIGGYRLERRLGKGGMGEVWLGRHVTSRGVAAVKLIGEAMRDTVDRFFQNERRAIGRLAHPHVLPVYEAGSDYLITAYIDGKDLAHRLDAPLSPASAVRIARQIASALGHAHERGVIHRDVKPGNVLLDAEGNAYLADFGIARLVGELLPEPTDVAIGTPSYMAPEQEAGDPGGPAADQFALARTLMVMLAGTRLPVELDAALALLPAGLPETLVHILRRATAEDPGSRFPSVTAFGDALASVDAGPDDAPAMQLTPELRPRERYAWCAHPNATSAIGPGILRADYRLSELADFVPGARAFLERTGRLEMGWAMFARSGRLGRVDDPAALARAQVVVVLLHGLLCTRESWRDMAATICRDNGTAVVLVPDIWGHGESVHAERDVAPEHIAAPALPGAILDWLALLGLGQVRTALVGHSAAATALLSVEAEELGGDVCRVAISPVFPAAQPSLRRQMRFASAACVLGVVPAFRRMIARSFPRRPESRGYGAEDLALAQREYLALSWRTASRLFASIARAPAASPPRLANAVTAVVEDDPVSPAEEIAKSLRAAGFPDEKLYRLASGLHFPHGENAEHPEWKARNIDDLVNIVEVALEGTRSGAPRSTRSDDETIEVSTRH